MRMAVFVALALGATAVLQAGLNRRIAALWGLAPTVFLNGVIVLALGAAFLLLAMRGPLEIALASDARWTQLRWWWFLPGVCGFALITGLPWVVARVGALQVFVGVVAAQMCASILWDLWMEGIAVSWARACGAALSVAGAVLMAWRA